jgi:prophage maintenance system killer protein
MATTRYPSVEDLIELNKRVLAEIRVKKANRHQVISRGGLDTLLERVREQEGGVYEKAVTLLTGLVRTHAFASGNRRTAYLATMGFLEVNGKRTAIVQDPRVLRGIREQFYTRDEIKAWLMGHEIKEFRRK